MFEFNRVKHVRPAIAVILLFPLVFVGQTIKQPTEVDEFGALGNDDLMSRVYTLNQQLSKDSNLRAVVIVSGNSWQRQVNVIRIQGCHKWLKIPLDRLTFLFDSEPEVKVQFWVIPDGTTMSKPETRPVDYDLSDLDKPVELSSSQSTDEYCPRYFDVDLYSHYMIANPSFTGKVIIDATRNQFVRRVLAYRSQLRKVGVAPPRIRFYRKHFYHERDEQWWLIPPKRK